MVYDIAIIGDEDTVLGFNLVGITKSHIFDETKIRDQIDSFTDVKILILTEEVAEHLRKKELIHKVKPVIAEIPDKSGGKGYALAEISRLFESAIGVALK